MPPSVSASAFSAFSMCTKNGNPRCGTDVGDREILRLGAGREGGERQRSRQPERGLEFA